MTLAEFIASPFAVAGLALSGALGSQLISARANLKSKRLELAYARKADAYRDFLTSITKTAIERSASADPSTWDDAAKDYHKEVFNAFYKSAAQAVLVASPELFAELDKTDSLISLVTKLYQDSDDEIEERSKKISGAFDKIQKLMRADLNRLGGL